MIRHVGKADIDVMNAWLEHHGATGISPDVLPPTGLMSDHSAIGFLYLTNSKAAWIENLVTNPALAPSVAAKAIDEVIEGLIELSKDFGVKEIFGLTRRNSVANWVERLGFVKGADDYTVVSRRL